MDMFLFKLVIILCLVLFVIPKQIKYHFTLALQLALIAITGYWAVQSLSATEVIDIPLIKILNSNIFLTIDKMSAFFILVINLTMLTGLLYAKGYLKSYYTTKNKTEIAFHYFNYLWLHISMILVASLRDGLSFLIAWELMSLSSFFLVIFESEKKETIQTGIKYLIQMHIGLGFILTAFLLVYGKIGGTINFDALSGYFATHSVFPVFLLFFIGFGMKAGFIMGYLEY